MMSRQIHRIENIRALQTTITRALSSNSKVERSWRAPVFYECSHYAVDHIEKSLIERSINGGVKSIVTRSSPHLRQYCELLLDLQDVEETHTYEIGHILQPVPNQSIDESIDSFRKEISLVSQTLHKKNNLSFINVALPLQSLLSLSTIQSTVEKISHYVQQENRDPSIGIDLTSSTINKLTPPQLQQITSNLNEFYHQRQRKDVALTIASNYMTLNNAKKIVAAVKESQKDDITVLGTEILRLHAFRPGQLSDDYRYMPYHTMRGENTTGAQKDLTHVKKAVGDFNRAIGTLLKVENELLSRKKDLLEKNDKVLLPHLFSGMRLVSNLSNFYFPEEWNIIMEDQIVPQLERQYEVIEKMGQDFKDWIIVHRPLTRYLFNSIRNILQERVLEYRDCLYQEYERDFYPEFSRGGNFSKEDTVAIVARTTKDVVKLDSVGISLTKLNIQDSTYEVITDRTPLPHAVEFQERIVQIVPKYNSEFFQRAV